MSFLASNESKNLKLYNFVIIPYTYAVKASSINIHKGNGMDSDRRQ